jgi:DNA-binding response OmpR family regulator
MATKVLVVEDDPLIAENLQALLAVRGYEVRVAYDGAMGVTEARQWLPDLILLDIMLPKIEGFEVCRLIKNDPVLKKSRVIMVTGLGRSGDVEAAFAAGANDYVFKPFDSDRLFKKIAKVMAAPGP